MAAGSAALPPSTRMNKDETMSDSNPYTPPTTPVSAPDTRPTERQIPETIAAPIRHGWIAACVSCAMTLLATLLSLRQSGDETVFSAFNLIDVGLIALLAFGIHRRSRTAATFMLAYFVLSKILVMQQTGQPTGLVFGLVFAIFYFRAMTATFRYHRFVKEWKRNPPVPGPALSENPLFAPSRTDRAP